MGPFFISVWMLKKRWFKAAKYLHFTRGCSSLWAKMGWFQCGLGTSLSITRHVFSWAVVCYLWDAVLTFWWRTQITCILWSIWIYFGILRLGFTQSVIHWHLKKPKLFQKASCGKLNNMFWWTKTCRSISKPLAMLWSDFMCQIPLGCFLW